MEEAKRTRAVLYCRLSKGESSLGDQEERCRSYCATYGWDVVEVLVEPDTSATRSKVRPQFERLIHMMEQDYADVAVAASLDRFARLLPDTERIIATGKQFAAVRDRIDTLSPGGRMLVRFLTLLGQHEAELISARVKDAKKASAMRGERPHGGQRAYGFTDDWTELVEDEAAALRHVAERIVAGDSLRSCTLWMVDHAPPPRVADHWTERSLRTVLLNPRLLGHRTYLGEVVHEGAFPAILDQGTFDAVRLVLQDASRAPSRGDMAMLSGLVRCGKCGKKMRKQGPKYVCRPRPHGCNGVSQKIEPLDEHMSLVAPVFSRQWDFARSERERRRAELEAERDALHERSRAVSKMFGQGLMTEGDAAEALAGLRPRLLDVERDLRSFALDTVEGTDARSLLHASVDAIFVAPVGRSWRGHIGHRVWVVRKGAPWPELPLSLPLPGLEDDE